MKVYRFTTANPPTKEDLLEILKSFKGKRMDSVDIVELFPNVRADKTLDALHSLIEERKVNHTYEGMRNNYEVV